MLGPTPALRDALNRLGKDSGQAEDPALFLDYEGPVSLQWAGPLLPSVTTASVSTSPSTSSDTAPSTRPVAAKATAACSVGNPMCSSCCSL